MDKIWDKLDGKQIALIVTSAGGIVLAGYLIFTQYSLTGNHLDHLIKSLDNHDKTMQSTNEVLLNLSSVIQGNTEITRSFQSLLKNGN